MDLDLGVGNLAGDEIDLRLDHREVAVGAALQHELAADGAQVGQLTGIDPHIERQHRGERRHDFFRRPALALLVDDVGLQEHAATHGESRQRFGGEGALRIILQRHVVAFRDALQERAVAGGALRVEAEVGDRPAAQDHDLHVGAADIADHVRVGKEVQRRARMRHRLDDGDVGADDVVQQILAVAGERQAADMVEAGGRDLPHQVLGVLDRVAHRQRVAAEQQLLLRRKHHRLGRGAAEVASDQDRFARRPHLLILRGKLALRSPVGLQKLREILCAGRQAAAAFARFLLVLALIDPPAQPFCSAVARLRVDLRLADFDAAEARVVNRFLRNLNESRRIAIGQSNLALGPDVGEVVTPGLLQAGEEQVRPAEQQHLRRRRVALGQRGEVLVDHRLEQAGDDLLDRHAALDQRVGIGLRENPALGADLVQRLSAVRHLRQRLRRNLQFSRGLLDEGAGAAAARRLHVDLLVAARTRRREKDRLHVFAADLGDELNVRVQFFHRRRDGDDLLDHLAADQRRDQPAAGAGEQHEVAAALQAAFALHAQEEFQHLFCLPRVVALIVLPQHLVVLDHDRLDGGRADIHSDDLHCRLLAPVPGQGWRRCRPRRDAERERSPSSSSACDQAGLARLRE